MALILNIETATKNCSVSLADEGEVVALKEYAGEGYLHAEKLHVFITDVLNGANKGFTDLDAVAVSMGPGSYTGLRIGVSAAKGLCYSLNIPLIAVDTLELLARRITVHEGVIIPLIDARRMEVYKAVYDPAYNISRPVAAEIITDASFNEYQSQVHLVGDGAAKCKEIVNASNVIYYDDIIYPSAAQMGAVSYQKHKKSDTVDVAYFEPYYLKDFMAGK
jgi:tRNA threonylcarbamoyladenosine biosynthesis protein TsaB